MTQRHNPGWAPAWPVIRAELPASLLAPRQARARVRHALSTWGLDALASDAELVTSELVANAAEHANGAPIGLTIRPQAGPGGWRGILCHVIDTAPTAPPPKPCEADSERGRGQQIVAALSASHGTITSSDGKTAWFILTTQPGQAPAVRHVEPELEAGA